MKYIKTYQVYIKPFLLTIFGPVNYGPPDSTCTRRGFVGLVIRWEVGESELKDQQNKKKNHMPRARHFQFLRLSQPLQTETMHFFSPFFFFFEQKGRKHIPGQRGEPIQYMVLYVATYWYAVSTAVGNAMPCHHTHR